MAIEKEVVIEYNKMIFEHTNDLWKIASALIALEIVMTAHVLHVKNVSKTRKQIRNVLFMSMSANAMSFVFGYLANAGLINNMEEYARDLPWSPNSVTEVFNLLQMISLTVGIVIFILAFFSYSEILAGIMTKVGVREGE